MIETNISFLIYYSIINITYFIGLSFLHSASKYKLILGLFGTIILSLFYSMRSASIGSDAGNYLSLLSNKPFEQEIEPFIGYIAFFVKLIGGGSILFFFIISLIINLLIFYVFYKIDKKNFLIYMAIFSTTFLFINSNINILRQGMAISVGFLSTYYLVNNKLKYYLLSVLLAIFIHFSAFILFLIPLILKIKTQDFVVKYVILMFFLYFGPISAVDFLYYLKGIHWSIDRIYWYLTWERLKPFDLKHVYYLYIGIIIIYLYKFNSISLQLKRYFLSFSTLLLVIILFRDDDFVVDRFSFYFIPLVIVLYVNLFKLLGIKRNKFYIFIFILLPFLWIFKSIYQFNLWWILGIMR